MPLDYVRSVVGGFGHPSLIAHGLAGVNINRPWTIAPRYPYNGHMSKTRKPPKGPDLLSKAIDARDLYQRDAAEAIGMEPARLSQILHRKRGPTLAEGVAIAREFGVDVAAWVA